MILEVAYISVNIFIGSRMRSLGNIMHECVHNIFVSHRKLNYIIGTCVAVFLFESFDQYKIAHLRHHRFLGNHLYDVDFIKYKKIKLNLFSNNRYNVIVSVLNPLNWFLGLKTIVVFGSKKQSIKVFKIFYFFCLLGLLFLCPKQICLYYFLPYITSYQMFKIFSDIVDHDYLYEKELIIDRSRNHIFSCSVLNWLFFPRNDAYHLVHHLYPGLRTSEYPERHQELLKKNFHYSQKNHSCDLQNFFHSGIQC